MGVLMDWMLGRRWARGLVACAMVLGAGGIVWGSPASPAVARAVQGEADWEQTPMTSAVWKLFAPRSGALLAWTAGNPDGSERSRDGLVRSDDGGESWRTIPLPTPPSGARVPRNFVEVDPVDHDILYAHGAEGLYQGNGDGSDWRVILEMSSLDQVVISPANHDVLYVVLERPTRLMRSRDRGATWETLGAWGAQGYESGMSGGCRFETTLMPHPTDPTRLFGSRYCELFESRDQGESWSTVITRDDATLFGQIREMVGGHGALPGRFYAVADKTGRERGRGAPPLTIASVLRSDDDGATWQTVVSAEQELKFTSLVADPAEPNRIFLGRGAPDIIVAATSADGGRTWSQLGRSSVYASTAGGLVLGVDRRNLYGGDDKGIRRLSLE